MPFEKVLATNVAEATAAQIKSLDYSFPSMVLGSSYNATWDVHWWIL